MGFGLARNPDLQQRHERANDEDVRMLDEAAAKTNTPRWASQFKFYRPPGINDASWDYVKQVFTAEIEGVRFQDQENFTFPMTQEIIDKSQDENFLGIPSLSVFSLGARSNFNPTGTNGHLGFSPVIPMTGAAAHGWGECRTHTAFMQDCSDAYSFNDHALRRLHEALKDAIDPNGIISAGGYGIWPKHLRAGGKKG